jgi:hypothetical protein
MRHADMIKRRMWARSGCNRRLETDLRKSIEQCQTRCQRLSLQLTIVSGMARFNCSRGN